jgi:hypothetical protein
MTRAHHVKSARKDNPDHGIKKGDSYYWWKFMRGGKHYSKTAPQPSQLTRSEFWSAVYSLGEEYAHTPELICDVESNVDDIKNRLQELADETQGKLDNMPQGLQDGDTGQMMQERISAIEDALGTLESLDISYETNDDQSEGEKCEEVWSEVESALDLSCS